MYDIATSSTQAEFTKVAEAKLADANSKFVAMIDTAAKNAPPGSETARRDDEVGRHGRQFGLRQPVEGDQASGRDG